jgi:hypothetical protein
LLRQALALNRPQVIHTLGRGWMKTTDSLVGGRVGDDQIYGIRELLVKFMQAYEAERVPIWPDHQNEPQTGTQCTPHDCRLHKRCR